MVFCFVLLFVLFLHNSSPVKEKQFLLHFKKLLNLAVSIKNKNTNNFDI